MGPIVYQIAQMAHAMINRQAKNRIRTLGSTAAITPFYPTAAATPSSNPLD
jgi:hypothetical protein